MTVVKQIMQDTIYTLVTKSMTAYVEFIESFIPEQVIITDVNKVQNIFHEEKKEDKLNTTDDLINVQELKIDLIQGEETEIVREPGVRWPLFQNNITKKDDRVDLVTKEGDLINDILKVFDEGLERMQQIPQVEPNYSQI